MTTQFPNGIDTFPRPVATDPLSNPAHAALHTNVSDAVVAMQQDIGTTDETDPATVRGALLGKADIGHTHNYAPLVHGHAITDVTNLRSELDALQDGIDAASVSPLTTKGDLFGFDTDGARIPVGLPGQILTADPAAIGGVRWRDEVISPVGGITLNYRFDSAVAAAGLPSGQYRLNNASPASATQMFVNSLTQSGNDASVIWDSLDSGDFMTFWKTSGGPAASQGFKLTSKPVAAGVAPNKIYTFGIVQVVAPQGTIADNNDVAINTISTPAATLPAGGNQGHVLTKQSGADYDVAWESGRWVLRGGDTMTGALGIPAANGITGLAENFNLTDANALRGALRGGWSAGNVGNGLASVFYQHYNFPGAGGRDMQLAWWTGDDDARQLPLQFRTYDDSGAWNEWNGFWHTGNLNPAVNDNPGNALALGWAGNQFNIRVDAVTRQVVTVQEAQSITGQKTFAATINGTNASMSGEVLAGGAIVTNTRLFVRAGPPNAQQIMSTYGANDSIPRVHTVLEGDGEFGFYLLDAAGNPAPVSYQKFGMTLDAPLVRANAQGLTTTRYTAQFNIPPLNANSFVEAQVRIESTDGSPTGIGFHRIGQTGALLYHGGNDAFGANLRWRNSVGQDRAILFDNSGVTINTPQTVTGRKIFESQTTDGSGDIRVTRSVDAKSGAILFGDDNEVFIFRVNDVQDFINISCELVMSGNVRPGSNPALPPIHSLGTATHRWSQVFAAAGTINTSDAREKTELTPLTAQELAAAKDLGKIIGTYKWLGAIAAKGAAARKHIGVTAQSVIEVMEAHGLDAMEYGFVCYDEWEASTVQEPFTGEDMVMRSRDIPAGDRYGVRYDELLAFIAAGFEARLAALEGA